MKKKIFTLTGGICLLSMSYLCSAQSTGTLIIEASHFKNDKGVVVAQLFREQDDVPKKPFLKASQAIANGKTIIAFQNLSYGNYALILFHDENANGILDHRFGLPNEPMGFSNEWKLSLFSGMPNFYKLRFEFSENKSTYQIAIR